VDIDDTKDQAEPAGVGKAWAWLLIFSGGMTVIAFTVWGTLSGAPSWFHALFGFQALWAIVGVANAYKRRPENAPGQPPL
jgi:Flp pilus assembly protein TadB